MDQSRRPDIDTPLGVDSNNAEILTLHWKKSGSTHLRMGRERVFRFQLERDLIRFYERHPNPAALLLVGVNRQKVAAKTGADRYLARALARVSLEATAFVLYAQRYDRSLRGIDDQTILRCAAQHDETIQRKRWGQRDPQMATHLNLARSVFDARKNLPIAIAQQPVLRVPGYNAMARGFVETENLLSDLTGSSAGTNRYFAALIAKAGNDQRRVGEVLLNADLCRVEREVRQEVFGDRPTLGIDRASRTDADIPAEQSRPTAHQHRGFAASQSDPRTSKARPRLGGMGIS